MTWYGECYLKKVKSLFWAEMFGNCSRPWIRLCNFFRVIFSVASKWATESILGQIDWENVFPKRKDGVFLNPYSPMRNIVVLLRVAQIPLRQNIPKSAWWSRKICADTHYTHTHTTTHTKDGSWLKCSLHSIIYFLNNCRLWNTNYDWIWTKNVIPLELDYIER